MKTNIPRLVILQRPHSQKLEKILTAKLLLYSRPLANIVHSLLNHDVDQLGQLYKGQ